jgi:hypothetical protein
MNKIVNEVIEYIRQTHFNSHFVAWNKISKSTDKIKSKKDLAIFLDKYLLGKLHDKYCSNFKIYDGNKMFTSTHGMTYAKSLFMKPYVKPQNYFSTEPAIKLLENNILYINAPRTWDSEYWVDYFKTINFALKKYNKYSGIIFDLSECLGGNYAPIIAPFHQIFGRTICVHGYNKNSPSNCFTHVLKKGKITDPDSWIKRVPFNPKKISDNRTSPVKIAVIISAYTGSAGELAALVFTGRPGVKIIGEKTAGMTIWKTPHYLKTDPKSSLIIPDAFVVDRTGKPYETNFSIKPDIKTLNPITKAIEFITTN